MKTKELFEGIQSRTKQKVPQVIKYKNMFIAVRTAWTKQQVIYSMAERLAEAPYWDDDDRRRPIWTHLIDRRLQPKDISDKDMKQFVIEWADATDNHEGDDMYNNQEWALEDLALKL